MMYLLTLGLMGSNCFSEESLNSGCVSDKEPFTKCVFLTKQCFCLITIITGCMIALTFCFSGFYDTNFFFSIPNQDLFCSERGKLPSLNVAVHLWNKQTFILCAAHVNLFFFLSQTKCFICGIGNDYFDTVPHGFETHTLQEHNLANYLWVLCTWVCECVRVGREGDVKKKGTWGERKKETHEKTRGCVWWKLYGDNNKGPRAEGSVCVCVCAYIIKRWTQTKHKQNFMKLVCFRE